MTDTAQPPTQMNAPAVFLGIQPGFDHHASIELYVLLSPVGHHPVGSTVSRQTLERHGFSQVVKQTEHSNASTPKIAQSAS